MSVRARAVAGCSSSDMPIAPVSFDQDLDLDLDQDVDEDHRI